ncbi:PAS domain S-box-containing protein/diguanylate cyclase (GGDEF)-like protein [Rhodobacter viridis]|uniref:PAS domain S-box-containing protein/diguanylate cyclase (GGDEF)-like protein n=1 Tax=Rhodobacter viridis TaxID=1054202 RepID=A0A318U6Y3_9RHOB|nr:PAS domain-containing protein [Rhodobacter viridis]PYF07709.1 PAS domain S-box-containing protein/diguanylate cyclase (GGDEF)-like protein [Rhodobacter viridis]
MSGDLAQLRIMFDGFPGAAFVLSRTAQVLWANAEAHRCYGESDFGPELISRPVAEVLPCELGARITRIVDAGRAVGAGMSQRFRVDLESDEETPPCADVTLWPIAGAQPEQLWALQILETVPRLGKECGAMPGALRCAASGARKDFDLVRDRALERADILRISTENSNVVPWYRFPERGVGRISPHLSTMLGYPADFHIDLPVLNSLIHPEDLSRVAEEFHDLMAGKIDAFCHDLRLKRADGGWTWITSRGRLVDRAEQGLPAMICGSLTDISERKAQEARLAEALAEAEAARAAAQATADTLTTALICGETAVWSVCAALGEAWMPDECYRHMGYEPGDFVPNDAGWRSLLHPDDLPEAIAKMEDLIFDRAPVFTSEHRLRHKDGSYHWYRTVARKIDRSDRGLPFLVSGGFTRIDEAKAIEARLSAALDEAQKLRDRAEERGELLRTSGLCAGVGHFSASPDLDEGWTPDETYRLFDLDPGAFPSTDAGWRSRIHPEDLPGAVVAMERLKAGETDIYNHEHRCLHADGSYHWYRAVARRVDRSDKGLPYLLAGAIISIDQSKENERRLAEEADKAHKARARLDTLADNAPGALFEYRRNADGSIFMPYFSAKFPTMLGVSRAAIERRGETVFQNVPKDTCHELLERIERSRTDGAPFEARFPVDLPDVGRRWLTVSSLPFAQEDGATLWFGTIFDVTEQVRMTQQTEIAAEAVRRAHDRMVTMAENSPGAIFEWQRELDGHFKFNFISAALPGLLGVSREALEADGATVFTHIPADDIPQVKAAVMQSVETLTRFEILHRITHHARGLRWLHVSASPFPQEDGTIIWYGNAMDVTERIEAKRREEQTAEAMHEVHERLASIASIAPVGLYEFRRFPDGSASFPYASPYLEDLLGIEFGLFSQSIAVEDLFANVQFDELPDFLTGQGAGPSNLDLWNQRFRVKHPTRGDIWLANSATSKGQPDGSVVWTGALHDVTADVAREAELRRAHRLAEEMRAENERQALHDGLTGLPNRRSYDNVLAKRISEAAAGGPQECVLIRVDLDHFKHVNDTLGHEAGDMVLQRVADVLRAELRGGDFAARIGGDEFSIILSPGQSGSHAREVVERMQARLSEPLMFEGRQCRFGASFGIAETEDIAGMGTEIQLFADAALYRAKEGGRSRMEFFTPELRQNILFDRKLAGEIQEGLERDEFIPFFQSQVASSDGRLTGVETLLRWRHPERGLLAPDAFMHVAQQLRLVPEIDRVMMEKSGEALAFWRAQGLHVPKISFNVSAGRMHDPDVVRAARAISDGETKVTFELLESILVEEESEVFRFHLDAIRDAGIEIEIDDFGSGHASIIGLMQIAPSALKIDQRIVAPVARDPRSKNLVRAIVEIAETLGIATVAEGVETRAQADILRDLGCDVLQGYLFSMPLSAEDFARFCTLEARRA